MQLASLPRRGIDAAKTRPVRSVLGHVLLLLLLLTAAMHPVSSHPHHERIRSSIVVVVQLRCCVRGPVPVPAAVLFLPRMMGLGDTRPARPATGSEDGRSSFHLGPPPAAVPRRCMRTADPMHACLLALRQPQQRACPSLSLMIPGPFVRFRSIHRALAASQLGANPQSKKHAR